MRTAIVRAILALSLVLFPRVALAGEGSPSELVVADATGPPPSLDPFLVFGTQAQSFFRLIFAPLFDRDPNGRLVTPMLDRWGQIDPLTWEFRLRPGIYFHDGEELNAADVAYSLGRIVDPDLPSPRRQDFDELKKIVATDRWTFRVTTKRPYALLPARLSQFSMIVPERLRGRPATEFFKHPVGLGPFKLTALDGGQAVLDAFQGFFGGKPKTARVIFKFIADPSERVRRLLEGSVDILTNLPPQQVEKIIRARHVHVLKRNSIRFMNIMLDTSRKPLAQEQVRQALRYGIDVEGLVKYVARGNGRALATVTLPEDFGFNEALKPYPFDPAKAKTLLAQAGYPRGFPLQGIATHETKTLAVAVASHWAKLGVDLELATAERAKATSRWIKERDRFNVRFLDPTSIIFDGSFQIRLHIDPGHPVARAVHPHALELLNRADSERDLDARAALLREIQAIFQEQVLGIPLYQVVDLYGVHDRVRGFVPSVDTRLRLSNVTLAP